jgi:lysophospholipase L1-like esterase
MIRFCDRLKTAIFGVFFCFSAANYAQVLKLEVNSGKTFSTQVEGNRAYKLQWSEDLLTWNILGDAFLPSSDVPFKLPPTKQGFVRMAPDFFVPDTSLRIGIIGDSTVADHSAISPQWHGWGQLMGNFLASNVRVVNQAEGGIGTREFIVQNRIARLKVIKPNVVIMQFGHIDNNQGVPDEEYEENLVSIVNDVRELGAIPMFATPVARRLFDEDGLLIRHLASRRESMIRVGEAHHVQLIDLNRRSAEFYNRVGDGPATFVTVCGNDCLDRSHFSRAGGYVMASLAAEELPPLLQAYRLPLESLNDEIVAAFKNDRRFPGLKTPFFELTGFQEEEFWSWVYPDQFPRGL